MPKIPPEFEFIIEKFPTAQRGALWILDTVGPIGDDALYDHLFTFLGLPRMAASEVSAERGAYYLLKAIEITVRNQKEKDIEALLTGKGGGKHGGSGSGAANPKAKGRGKAKEQKGNPPEMESRR